MEMNHDHFSYLPDNMITQIFSFLTMKEALAVCISCKKLMHLRTTIPHLEFKESADDSFSLLVDAKKRNLVHAINQLLNNHNDYPIQTFRLDFYPGWYSDDVFRWISTVMQRSLIELDLNFLSNLGSPIQLPSYLLNSITLQALKLRSCCLDFNGGNANLNSLKSVFLEDVILCDAMMDTLLCQSGLLQSLSLKNCSGFETIKVLDTNDKLEYLSLENCHGFSFLFAPQVKVLSIISTGEMSVFVIAASQITNLQFFYQSSNMPSRHKAQYKTYKMLNSLKLSDKEVEHRLDLEYLGIAKMELEIYCPLKELHGHTWLLKNDCVDKVVLSMFDD